MSDIHAGAPAAGERLDRRRPLSACLEPPSSTRQGYERNQAAGAEGDTNESSLEHVTIPVRAGVVTGHHAVYRHNAF
jgi:hypothetical protein